jgi:hypothetical protein
MMRNQEGFMYPLSLCFLVFFNVFTLLAIQQGLAERSFYKETETILAAEYYLLSSVKEAERQLREGKLPEAGKFSYEKGEVAYRRKVFSPSMDEITFTLKLNSNEQWATMAHYDKVQRRMVKWIEKN